MGLLRNVCKKRKKIGALILEDVWEKTDGQKQETEVITGQCPFMQIEEKCAEFICHSPVLE